MQELEGDREMRSTVNLFRRTKKREAHVGDGSGGGGKAGGAGASAKMATGDDELDDEEVRLDELLDELTLAGEEPVFMGKTGDGEDPAVDPSLLRPVLLTAAEADAVPAIPLPTTGFDLADFDLSKPMFK